MGIGSTRMETILMMPYMHSLYSPYQSPILILRFLIPGVTMNKSESYFIEKLLYKKIDKERKAFKGTKTEFEKRFKARLPKLLAGLNKTLRTTLIKICISEVKRKAKTEKKLLNKIATRYKGSLPYFDIFIEFNVQIGNDSYRKYYKQFKTLEDHVKLDTLIEIHVRACQIASEVNLLVKNGYADGAHARWRSLHELCIMFLFLYYNSHEVVRMYQEYLIIETWDKFKKHNEAHPKLGWGKLPKKEFEKLTIQRQYLIDKYGKDFSKSYGWTMSVLPPGKRTIRGIEEHVQKDYLRGIYSWASENVHAGISGNKKRLGLAENKLNHFLTGPTEHGLLDPIQFTSYSLMKMSDTLLHMEDSILNQLYSQLLVDLHYTLVTEFNKTDKRREKRT